jgi:hypothetical protein
MDAGARSWMEAELAAAGLAPLGALEVTRERPWGSVGRIATDRGALWLKASARATAFEAGIYAVLAEVAPEHVLAPVALDVAHGRLLLPDGGPALGEQLAGDALVAALTRAMAAYAQLQRAAAPRVDALLAAGVPDMRPQVLPARFDAALGFVAPEQAERLRALRPDVVAWCEQLAAAPGAASVDHNDLHPGNMLDGGARFYDWGDAVIAHPFACLLMPLGYVSGELGRDPSAVLHAYLDGFADLAPRDDLLATARLAVQLAKIARAHTWERALRAAAPGDPQAERFRNAPAQTLAGLWDGPWERVL